MLLFSYILFLTSFFLDIHLSLKIYFKKSFSIHPIYVYSYILYLISILILIYNMVNSNFVIETVINYTHSSQSLLYKVFSLCASSNGSIFLFIFFNKLFLILFIKNNHLKSIKSIIFVNNLINLYLYIYILLIDNIFKINIFKNIIQGIELNPILQDPLLLIHPPIIFVGYTLFLIIFSVNFTFSKSSMSNLFLLLKITKKTFIIFTIGIMLGSWWAYFELGWGGW